MKYDPGPRMFGPVCLPCGRETRRVKARNGNEGKDVFECLDCGWRCPVWYEDAAGAFAIIEAAQRTAQRERWRQAS